MAQVPRFVHLHCHSEFSLLDGMGRLPQLLARCRELGMDSLALTDHGALYGAVAFYRQAREAGVKPLIGCELYLAPGTRTSRVAGDKGGYHLILLAKDAIGYHNLIQLVTRAHLEGFFYKPRADRELLQKYSQGLVALSACPQGEVGKLLLEGRDEEARRAALWYKEVFGDFYLEVQPHPVPEIQRISRGLVEIATELGLPLVATNDVHYVSPEDAPYHDLLLCIQTNTSIYDEKRIRMPGPYFYLRSPQEMAELFGELPQALAATVEVAEKCSLELEFGRLHLPQIEVPPGKSPEQYLEELCWEGFHRRYPHPSSEAQKRLEYELEVIRRTGFTDYFLVVWDIASFARSRGILMGVRGSAAASLVLYCLGVTELDPLEHRLVFERFLNLERREMPDIDLDFQDDRREEVLTHVSAKYGQDHVAQIITFGTMGARAVVRDVGRALGMSYGQADRVARLIPAGPNVSLERALEENRELREIYLQDEAVKKLIDSARRLEGLARHASTHAAGVVISREPLTNYVPLQRVSKGEGVMTQFSMEDIAQIGLLKMDLLGLANLTILARAQELVAEHQGQRIDLSAIPLDDPKTYELLSAGETGAVFQLEGVGMRRYIRELKPSTFSDIAAMVALYRPGPMEHIPTFIRAKHGLEPVRYPHPALEDILRETYGVIVYQDQVLLIVQALAGYTLGEADIIRKAMGKKIPEVMRREKQSFLRRAKSRGVSPEAAEEVFQLIEPFAGYAFNKAHSVSYALIAYQTAYLKANFPQEYMTAQLNTYRDNQEKVAAAIAECQRLGIRVLPPDINRSQALFSLEGEGIRFGLAVVKNVGDSAIEPVLAARKQGGTFKSVEDFCRRVDLRGVNRRALESLIKVGALDSVGSRLGLLHSLERMVALSQQEQRLKERGQSTMFDLWGASVPPPLPDLEVEALPLPPREQLAWEKELLGVFLSENPLQAVVGDPRLKEVNQLSEVDQEMVGKQVVVVGMVSSLQHRTTREGKPFISATLEDLSGSREVTAWSEVFNSTRELWQEGNILRIRGRVRARGEEVGAVAEAVELFTPQSPGAPTPITPQRLIVRLWQTDEEGKDRALMEQTIALLRAHPGELSVRLQVSAGGRWAALEIPGLAVDYTPQLNSALSALLGEEALELEPQGR